MLNPLQYFIMFFKMWEFLHYRIPFTEKCNAIPNRAGYPGSISLQGSHFEPLGVVVERILMGSVSLALRKQPVERRFLTRVGSDGVEETSWRSDGRDYSVTAGEDSGVVRISVRNCVRVRGNQYEGYDMKLCISFGLKQDLCAVSAISQYFPGSHPPSFSVWPTITSICWFVCCIKIPKESWKPLTPVRETETLGHFTFQLLSIHFALIDFTVSRI